jgi:FkbM family methyltransferase
MVYAVEMEPENYGMLCQNIERNKLAGIIIPILGAVSDKFEIAPLYYSDNRGQFSLCFKSKYGANGRHIIATPIHSLILNINATIDFLKVDIEGMEYKIFREVSIAQSFLERTRFMFLELHGPNKRYFDDDFFWSMGYDPEQPQEKLFEVLAACGFAHIKQTDIGQVMVYNDNFKGV